VEPAKFRSKGAGVGVIKGKWPPPEPESELRSFENLPPEQEPLKFSRLHQTWLTYFSDIIYADIVTGYGLREKQTAGRTARNPTSESEYSF